MKALRSKERGLRNMHDDKFVVNNGNSDTNEKTNSRAPIRAVGPFQSNKSTKAPSGVSSSSLSVHQQAATRSSSEGLFTTLLDDDPSPDQLVSIAETQYQAFIND